MRLAEQEVDLLLRSDKRLLPESVHLVVKQLDKHDDEAPWMRSANDHTLEKDTADAFSNLARYLRASRSAEDEEHEGNEEEGVSGRVAQLVCDGGEQVVLAWKGQRLSIAPDQLTFRVEGKGQVDYESNLGRFRIELGYSRLRRPP